MNEIAASYFLRLYLRDMPPQVIQVVDELTAAAEALGTYRIQTVDVTSSIRLSGKDRIQPVAAIRAKLPTELLTLLDPLVDDPALLGVDLVTDPNTCPTIMICEDDPDLVKLMIVILESSGFAVVWVGDTAERAVTRYRELKPDLVLMDINLPGADGLAATSAIIKFDPEARVIMLSSSSTRRNVLKSVDAGCRTFIAKPFKPDRLLAVVREVLAGAE